MTDQVRENGLVMRSRQPESQAGNAVVCQIELLEGGKYRKGAKLILIRPSSAGFQKNILGPGDLNQ